MDEYVVILSKLEMDLNNVTTAYDLRSSKDYFVHNNGTGERLDCLQGTIPVPYKGTMYNIPVKILLMIDHPIRPPMVFVNPAHGMAIVPGKFVLNSGRVNIPYLAHWSQTTSTLTGLVQTLCIQFAVEMPLRSELQVHTTSQDRTNVRKVEPGRRAQSILPSATQLSRTVGSSETRGCIISPATLANQSPILTFSGTAPERKSACQTPIPKPRKAQSVRPKEYNIQTKQMTQTKITASGFHSKQESNSQQINWGNRQPKEAQSVRPERFTRPNNQMKENRDTTASNYRYNQGLINQNGQPRRIEPETRGSLHKQNLDRRSQPMKTQHPAEQTMQHANKKNTQGKGEQQKKKGKLNGRILAEIVELPTNQELLVVASGYRADLKTMLNSDKRNLDKLILRFYHRVCKAQQNEISSSLLALLRESKFITVSIDDSFNEWEDSLPPQELQQLSTIFVAICEVYFKMFPTSYKDVRPGLLKLISRNMPVDDLASTKRVDSLMERRRQLADDKPSKAKTQRGNENKPPPNDFHEISVYPQHEDIHCTQPPFLRQNRTSGGYESGEHYLDVQFRLLRADLVIPLKAGIEEIFNNVNPEERTERLKIYEGVKLKRIKVQKNGIEYEISFAVKRKVASNIWEHNRKLLFGSLLCLSKDGFKSMIFATVGERKPKDLEKGLLCVVFENDEEGRKYTTGENTITLQMVESSTFFPAYKHVLHYLKDCDPQNVPMQKYLVRCEQDVPPPAYLRNVPNLRYQFNDILELPKFAYQNGVRILDNGAWPTYEETVFNESQLEAFKNVLTKEFAIMQGPPGTGKTFVGLKIADTLLNNKQFWVNRTEEVWNEENENYEEVDARSPMLVVCYTNHALDQFVNGLVEQGHENILRIGGRMDESLKDFTLQKMYEKINSKVFKDVKKSLWQVYQERDSILERIDKNEALFSCDKNQHEKLLSMDELEDVMDPKHVKDFRQLRQVMLCYGKFDCRKSHQINVMHLYLGLIGNMRHEFSNSNVLLHWLQDGFTTVPPEAKEMSRRIRERYSAAVPMNERQMTHVYDPWGLNFDQRWSLYKYWSKLYHASKQDLVTTLVEEFNEAQRQIDLLNEHKLKLAMKHADVIAMTSTRAAMARVSLGNLRPRIVIIEEAAEVFEAHVLASLTSGVEHLILIGDHKQLRPNPSTYELVTKFKFDISLFERMLNNNIRCTTLDVQHRMGPHISRLMRHEYPALVDHPCVTEYPPVKGVGLNIAFVAHTKYEKVMADSQSKTNEHEAKFIAALARYLVQQGYDASRITILTFYMGQVIAIKSHLSQELKGKIRISAIDNYQGEENDIILLSLVRSNRERRIGFVSNENRITVALSRAKHGLFAIGNFEMLREKSKYWEKVVCDMEKAGCYVESLSLRCERHPKEVIEVSTLEDFKKAPEGGCSQKCNFRLPCGHVCPRFCHPSDPNHVEYKCQKKCSLKSCPFHNCQAKCHYGEKCPPCEVVIQKVRESCSHQIMVACSRDPESVKCMTKVREELPCGHKGMYECHIRYDELECQEPCTLELSCGHSCTGTCSKCYKGRVHARCTQKCDRVLVCSHICKQPCASDCPPCQQKCQNACVHSRCPKKCCEPCAKCMEPCPRGCKHQRCMRRCSEVCNIKPCMVACDRVLSKCGHPCIGLCGEPCPNKCRVCDKDEVEEIFFGTEDEPDACFVQLPDCRHVFEASGLDAWFKNESETTNQANSVIKMKECPRCKTVVRKCPRYGNQMKAILSDIEKVKSTIYNGFKMVDDRDLHRLLERIRPYFANVYNKYNSTIPSDNYKRHTMLVHLELCYAARDMCQENEVVKILENTAYTLRQLSDVEVEIRRRLLIKTMAQAQKEFDERLRRDPSNKKRFQEAKSKIRSLEKKASSFFKNQEEIRKLSGKFASIRKEYSITDLTGEEKLMITQAMGLGKGHWYKCPKGHVYAIGECGGAMQTSKCPECGSTIGGSNHALSSGNQHAGDFDGSRYAAYSETANDPGNWDPELLRLWQGL